MNVNINSIYHPYDGVLNSTKMLLRKYIDDCDSISDQISKVEIEIGRLIELEQLDYDELFEIAKTAKIPIINQLKMINQIIPGFSQIDTKHYNLSFLLEKSFAELNNFVLETKSRVLIQGTSIQFLEDTELTILLGDILGIILAYREYTS